MQQHSTNSTAAMTTTVAAAAFGVAVGTHYTAMGDDHQHSKTTTISTNTATVIRRYQKICT